MKRYKPLDIAVSAIAFILIIALSAVLGILKVLGKLEWEVNLFLLIFTTLTLLTGVYVTVFAIVKKGGYELSVGYTLLLIGIILLLVALKVYFVITIIVGVALALIGVLLLFILKAKSLVVERTDEDPNFVSYNEKLAIEKRREESAEEPMPEIKSFKD